ncbi:MAG TPA: hypothetical protein VI997_01245 [Candidatus Thermoplasmatota archaeon]|nr:hypothetical protein [Candidatus Thermoplasmatota archaeon]
MPRALAVLLAAAPLLAGCFGGDADDAAEGGPSWLPGDRWTYRLDYRGTVLTDEWAVLGPAEARGRPVLEVASTTKGPGVDARDVGSFDAATLALVQVATPSSTVEYEPSEVQLLPAADRAYTSTQTETRDGRSATARVDYGVRYVGVESVGTDAGTFSAHRFEVRETRHRVDGTSEASSTYWWAPAVVNVVRHEAPDGTVYRMLTSYDLEDGPRTLPDA